MTRRQAWLVGVSLVGMAAGAAAAALCWLMLTKPLAIAQYVQHWF
jgi:hypothetical protein